MIELAYINKRKKSRTVVSIGSGLPCYGQICFMSFVREDLSDSGNEVLHATMLWRI